MKLPDQVFLEHVSCPLCGSINQSEVVFAGRDRLHDLPGEFTVVKCSVCELMYTNPRPTPETIGFYYPENYGPYQSTDISQVKIARETDGTASNFLKKILKLLYRKIIHFNTACLPQVQPGRLLEIGCASGAFLDQMMQSGWDVEGIEFSANAADKAIKFGFNVHVGSLETAPDPAESFDLIVGWMVLEHLHDPIECLTKLRRWAKPDTWLVLSVPNAGSLEFSFFRERWYALQLPTHLCHYTPKTLKKVLNAGGWETKKIYHQRNLSNLIASTGHLLYDHGRKQTGRKLIDFPERAGRWHHLVLYPLAWLLSLAGQTGRMTVWAKAKS